MRFKGVRTREGKLMYRRRSKLEEPGGIPETPFPTFSAKHFQQINTEEKCSSPLFF